MTEPLPSKDPVRVMTGRMGALSVHSRGKTNTGPATAARWAKYERDVDPNGTLDPEARHKRAQYAQRLDMTRLAMARWGHARNVTTPAPLRG